MRKININKKIFNEMTILEGIFIFSMLTLFIFFIVGLFLNFKGDQANIFFAKTGNYMADYYNNAKYATDRNPYYNTINGYGEKPYLPISYVIMYLMSKLADYSNLDSLSAGRSTMGLVTSSLFMFFISAILFLQIFEMKKGPKTIKFFTTILMFLSGIFFFSFERGNIIILSVVLIAFFIGNYQSENKVIRELAYICLALAASLKVYPAMLGILLLYEKKYFDAIRVMIYGVIFAFMPFIFLTGGFLNISQWFRNIRLNSSLYEFSYYPRFGYRVFLTDPILKELKFDISFKDSLNFILSIFTAIMSIISLGFAAFQSKMWKKIGMIICIIILLPVNSALYCGLYMFPVIALFLNDNEHKHYEILYLFCFIALLNPFQIINNNINLSMIITSLSVSVLFILLFVESIIAFKKYAIARENKLLIK